MSPHPSPAKRANLGPGRSHHRPENLRRSVRKDGSRIRRETGAASRAAATEMETAKASRASSVMVVGIIGTSITAITAEIGADGEAAEIRDREAAIKISIRVAAEEEAGAASKTNALRDLSSDLTDSR